MEQCKGLQWPTRDMYMPLVEQCICLSGRSHTLRNDSNSEFIPTQNLFIYSGPILTHNLFIYSELFIPRLLYTRLSQAIYSNPARWAQLHPALLLLHPQCIATLQAPINGAEIRNSHVMSIHVAHTPDISSYF